MTENERNQFDKRDSLEIGNAAQEKFKIIATSKGWKVVKATKDQDINEHWDYLIIKDENNQEFKVDVKALKRISRSDDKVQEEWIWIEFHGVRQNELGWLFGGKADLFAFERSNDFVIIANSKLKELASRLVNQAEKVNSASEAKYKVYSRSGRPDIISMIEMKHIFENAWEIWRKE